MLSQELNYYSIFQKGNETERHYMLKQISKYIAFQRGFKICAEEVNLYSTNKLGNKNIADLVGIRMSNTYGRKEPKIDTICIEAKQSRSDYMNSFVSSADFNYIIAPKGLLTKEDMLDGVGLIEVDFSKLKFNKRNMDILNGVETVKKATRNKECTIIGIDMLRQIAYRNTVETLFVRHGIKERS